MQFLSCARAQVSRFDAEVDALFDRLRGNPVADRVFYLATELGDFSLIWGIIGGLRGLRSDKDWHVAVRLAAGVTAESFIVNAGIKSIFRRDRPVWEVERPHRIRRPLTSSFPSGHATSAFSSAVLLAEDDALWPAYYALAAIVAASRVYVRIHHPSDVAAGAITGVALGLIGRRLMPLPPAPDLHAG